MNIAARILLGLALAACGGSTQKPLVGQGPPPPPPPDPKISPPTSECDKVIEHVFTVTTVDEKPEVRQRARAVFVKHCETDQWSAEIRQCLLAMKVNADGDVCEKLLSKEQRDMLTRDLSKELDAAGVKPAMQDKTAPSPKKKTAKPPPGGGAGRTGDPCQGGE